jgi:DNA modification methylase
MDYLPDNSVDLIFTDPPFGSNINYSEMNILWEAWLGKFTNATEEAIVSKIQRKGISQYQTLMTQSFQESWRVLKPGHWMLVVFMNSSTEIWEALRQAIGNAGFHIVQVDIFDKQHSTFKQLVSENTVGSDLVLHCRKGKQNQELYQQKDKNAHKSIINFLTTIDVSKYRVGYIHVDRDDEIDFSRMYGEWTARALTQNNKIVDYAEFRGIVGNWLSEGSK